MSEILNLRAAIVTDLLTHTGESPDPGRLAGVKIYAHGGEFDNEKELERYSKSAMKGAVFVSVLGAEGKVVGGVAYACVTMGAFVLAVSKVNRDEMAIAISDALMNYIVRWPSKSWSVEAKAPTNVTAHNLYNEKLDTRAAALWGVFWQQDVELKTAPEPVLDNFLELDIDYNVVDP
jgi:hypothetical protein